MSSTVTSDLYSDTNITFVDFLRGLRQKRRLTLGQLALRSGVGKASLSRWEAGISIPRVPELSRVFEALEVPGDVQARALQLLAVPRAIHAARKNELAPPHFSLGDMLFALRQRSGRTQADTARSASVSRSAYAYWENDANVPTTAQLHAVAFALEATGEEVVALTSRAFATTPIEKDRGALFARYDAAMLLWNFASEADYRLHLLVLLANFGFLMRQGKADHGDMALIAAALAEGENHWHDSESAQEYYQKARSLAGKAKERLHRHMVTALQAPIEHALGKVSQRIHAPLVERSLLEALWGWLPALADKAGKAYLLSFVARYLAAHSPEEALRLGSEYCRLVADNEAEFLCRERDYANLLRICGKPAESVAHLAAIQPQDTVRAGLLQMDMAKGLLVQGAHLEAESCLSESKRLMAQVNGISVGSFFQGLERSLETAKKNRLS